MIPLELCQERAFELDSMTEHDLLEVVEIEEACGLSRWGWEGYHTELLAVETSLMFVARLPEAERRWANFSIAGFIAARLAAGEVHINNVAVRESCRRSKIGSALLAHVLAEGRRRGGLRAFLEVRASNEAAQRLYARQNFQVIGRRPNYYSAPAEDALVMALWL